MKRLVARSLCHRENRREISGEAQFVQGGVEFFPDALENRPGNGGFWPDNRTSRLVCANLLFFSNVFPSAGRIVLPFRLNDAIVQQAPDNIFPIPPVDLFKGGYWERVVGRPVLKIDRVLSPRDSAFISRKGGIAVTKRVSTNKTKIANTSKSGASQEKKGTKAKKSSAASTDSPVGDQEVTIDRRQADRRQQEPEERTDNFDDTLVPKIERRKKVSRRRQIDPTTCERDYSDQEVEFMNALEKYKRQSGRMFPTCSEVLEVIRGLDYVQLTPAEVQARQEDNSEVESPKEPESFDEQQEDNLEELVVAGVEDNL